MLVVGLRLHFRLPPPLILLKTWCRKIEPAKLAVGYHMKSLVVEAMGCEIEVPVRDRALRGPARGARLIQMTWGKVGSEQHKPTAPQWPISNLLGLLTRTSTKYPSKRQLPFTSCFPRFHKSESERKRLHSATCRLRQALDSMPHT
jgi:hypothetical protein